MSLARFDVNLLLGAVAALSAALAIVAGLHLYAWCFLRPRRSSSTGFPVAMDYYPPDGHEVPVVHVGSGGGGAASGLDALGLSALPVFVWQGAEGAPPAEPVRCAVCLGEMKDGELGRLLPACRHVYHAVCIDKWFRVSTVCPICRTSAEAATDEPEAAA